MDSRSFKNSVYSEISSIVKALSNSNRLEIIDFLSNGAKCVEEIALETGISVANSSQHLQTLKKERLVKATKEGVFVSYSLASPEVYKAWKSLRELSLNRSFELRDLITQYQEVNEFDSAVSLQEISQRNDTLLVDLRQEDEYQKGHFKNAVSIPSLELEDRLNELPKDKLIVAYCRGMFCSIADKAVNLLKENGYMAKKIEEHPLDEKIKIQ